jgi:uncharacterized protein YrrD
MLIGANELKGYAIEAVDGEIGAVEEFYFDDDNWTIRYLVAETGTWIPGRKVLVSPISVDGVDRSEEKVRLKLTREQVEKSPDIDAHMPVSRVQEVAFFRYYGYPYYWAGPYAWGPAAFPEGLAIPAEPAPEPEEQQAEAAEEDFHLRSTREVTGYYIEGTDGEIGHVADFVVDDESWAIRYLVIDTRNWLPGKKVVVAPGWIHRISWRDSKVYVNLSREAIKQSPEYDPSKPLTRDYEAKLYTHYDRPRYWEDSRQ